LEYLVYFIVNIVIIGRLKREVTIDDP